MKTVNFKSLLLMVAALFAMTLTTFGQQDTGSISGTVKDQNDAVVSGATVKVVNPAKGFERTATTNGDGYYVITNLAPAQYEITINASGFKEQKGTVQVSVGGASTVNATLGLAVNVTVVDVPAGSGGLAEVNTAVNQMDQATQRSEEHMSELQSH